MDNRQKAIIATGAGVAFVMVAALYYRASLPAAVVGAGSLALCGFVLYDRMTRKLWEAAISFRLMKIDQAQANISEKVERAVKNSSVSQPTPRKILAPTQTTPRRDIHDDPDDTMPLAVRPGMQAPPPQPKPQSYGTIATSPPSAQQDLSDNAVLQITNDALRSERIDVFLQPIVRLPQRKVRYYEMFARIRARPGFYLPAARYMKIGQDTVMAEIDRLLLTECLDILRATAKLERAAPFFFNIRPDSLKSPIFMKKLLSFLGNNRELAPRLIFEIAQDDFKTLPPAVLEIMKGLSKLDCCFSIDNIKTIDFDVETLQKRNVRFVKIAAENLLPKTKNEKEFAELLRMKRKLEANGIAVVAEKIENEKALKELLDLDISYGQGYLFGKPDLQGAYQKKAAAN